MNYNIAFDEFIALFKDQSEKHFAELELDKDAYGLQHQKGTRWRPGLTEQELLDFQREVGFDFPAELLAFYRVMNGTDLPGVNIYGEEGLPYYYAPIYFSYPEHLFQIKQAIEERLVIKGLIISKLKQERIPFIFPINDFYFMIIDNQTNPVYFLTPAYKNHDVTQAYVYGSLWTDTLQSWLIKDIFHRTDHITDLEEFPARKRIPNYWTTEDNG
ncbi:MAG: SMI1/KNR4 family protein [Hymenobacter sp.]|nr:MAG: SMI1/KNR4 family protein [Hymenobacter sp.]